MRGHWRENDIKVTMVAVRKKKKQYTLPGSFDLSQNAALLLSEGRQHLLQRYVLCTALLLYQAPFFDETIRGAVAQWGLAAANGSSSALPRKRRRTGKEIAIPQENTSR